MIYPRGRLAVASLTCGFRLFPRSRQSVLHVIVLRSPTFGFPQPHAGGGRAQASQAHAAGPGGLFWQRGTSRAQSLIALRAEGKKSSGQALSEIGMTFNCSPALRLLAGAWSCGHALSPLPADADALAAVELEAHEPRHLKRREVPEPADPRLHRELALAVLGRGIPLQEHAPGT